jgi:hypothetical protein
LNLNGGSHSNNLFYRTSGSADGVIGIGEYGSSVPLKTFDRSSVTSYEASAQGSDPMFKNVVNLPAGFTGIFGTNMEPTTDGLLISTGDAIGQGATLDTSYNGAINLSGRSGGLTRPSTGGWDIGAYQYQSSNSEKPHAPNNFRAVQQSR